LVHRAATLLEQLISGALVCLDRNSRIKSGVRSLMLPQQPEQEIKWDGVGHGDEP
jgi:hypothetical protein